jgi:SNF2 family DNA or RNA helicase
MIRHWYFDDTPYEVQNKALDFTWRKADRGYFMDMGLGKTKVTISDFMRHHYAGFVNYFLIVCPNNLKSNWKNEWAEMNSDIPLFVYPDDRKEIIANRMDPCAVVFNYERLLTDHGIGVFDTFIKTEKAMTALDESSRIKNPQSLTTKTLIKPDKGLGTSRNKVIKMRRCLTGTPQTQSPLDYYPQLKFEAPNFPLTPHQFKTRFCKMGGFMNKQIVGVQREEELRELLGKHFFIARKGDWLDLPEKLYQIREFEMVGAQKEAYKQMKGQFVATLADGNSASATIALSQLEKLLQISRGFVINDNGEISNLTKWEENPVFLATLDTIQEAQGKVVVMTHHRVFSENLLAFLSKHFKCEKIFGGMSPQEIEAGKARFNQEDSQVIVCQLGVGAMGHTLLGNYADRCSTMIFAENIFSLEKRLQGEDRIHRIGQDKGCLYVDIMGTPVDKRVQKILKDKKTTMEKIQGVNVTDVEVSMSRWDELVKSFSDI